MTGYERLAQHEKSRPVGFWLACAAGLLAALAALLSDATPRLSGPLLEVTQDAGSLPTIVRLPASSHKHILLPLANRGFDPTEVAIPWYALTAAGHTVTFATPEGGDTPQTDQRVLDGYLFGLIRASPETREIYRRMKEDSASFNNPLPFDEIVPGDFDGLVLPGGHDAATSPYLESHSLQAKVRQFWKTGRPVAAVCHGVLVLSRAGVFSGGGAAAAEGGVGAAPPVVRTTAVTRQMERFAYHLTRPFYGDYHLSTTWPRYTQDEIEEENPGGSLTFEAGSPNPLHPVWHGSATDHRRSHVVEDGHYLSARFPGDVWTWALRFGVKVTEPHAAAIVTDGQSY